MSISGTSKRIDFPVVGSFAAHHNQSKISAERTINMYEVFDDNAKKPNYLALTPGISAPISVSNSHIIFRTSFAHFDINVTINYAYFVVGNTLFRMDAAETVTPIVGLTLSSTTGFVGFALLNDFIALADGGSAWIYQVSTGMALNITTMLQTQTGLSNFLAADVTSMDGYFIFVDVNSNNFIVSELNLASFPAAAIIPPTFFAQVNSYPTTMKGLARLKRRLFLFGSTITEVWLDAGASDFPFRRDNNLLFEHGLEAPGSLVEGFDRLFYLSRDEDGVGSIYMVDGVMPQIISPHELDELIQSFGTTNDAVGFVYRINGQLFYQITFPSAKDDFGNVVGRTFVYNVKTNKFHELAMQDGTRHLANTHVFFNNIHYVGSYKSANLFKMAEQYLSNTDDNGNEEFITRTRICHVFNSPTYERVRIDRLQIDMIQGSAIVQNTVDFDEDVSTIDNPQVHLSISQDGGITYQDFGLAPIGKMGEHLTRTIWRNLGVRRDSILKFEIFVPINSAILGGAIDIAALPE